MCLENINSPHDVDATLRGVLTDLVGLVFGRVLFVLGRHPDVFSGPEKGSMVRCFWFDFFWRHRTRSHEAVWVLSGLPSTSLIVVAPALAGVNVPLRRLPCRCSGAHLQATLMPGMCGMCGMCGMWDDHHVLSLHASFLHGHSVHAGVISAIHASLFAGASCPNLVQYRPESGVPVVTMTFETGRELVLSAWFLYVSQ